MVTFFFSTSGGRTEHVENTPLGTTPLPWLRSVADPFDSVSPRHRWGPIRMTYAAAGRKLQGLVRGRFRGIEVITPRALAARRGRRRCSARAGARRVSGATLRARFGLYDTWAYFTSIAARPAPAPPSDPATGGTDPTARAAHRPAFASLAGAVHPARAGASVVVQQRRAGRWTVVGWARTGPGGRYRAPVPAAGRYRIAYRGDTGATVRIPTR